MASAMAMALLPVDDKDSKWLNAFSDPLANLYTFTACMALSDLSGDGDYKLIIADLGTGSYNMKLKVYKGTTVMSENTLIDLPTAVAAFFMDNVEPRVPAIAVASGACIFVYKNLKPYYKFTLPSLEIANAEREVWDQVRMGKIDTRSLNEFIESLRVQLTTAALTPRSQRFLMLPEHEREAFVNTYKEETLKHQTIITCLTTLNRNAQDADAIKTLVFGSENSTVSIVDSEAFTMLAETAVPSVPVFLHASGLYDVEYRILVVCRNGCVYSLKRGQKFVAKAIIELSSHAVGLTKIQKQIFIACMDDTLRCYSLKVTLAEEHTVVLRHPLEKCRPIKKLEFAKGKKLFSLQMPCGITTIECMDYKPKNHVGIIVALENKQIHIYRDMFLVDCFEVDDVVTALTFGCFGREEGALVMAMRGGGLCVKLLKRTAKFEDRSVAPGPPAAQNTKLQIPKKTKIFVDQTMREREQAVRMHQTFQRDLFMLRLETARAYAKTLQSNLAPLSSTGGGGGGSQSMIRLSAEVQGFGPTFLLSIYVLSTDSEAQIGLYISFMYNSKLYSIESPYIPLSMLVPGVQYTYKTKVSALSDKGLADDLKVFVSKDGQNSPLITAIISMPVSEMPLV